MRQIHPIFWVLPLENSHNINNNCFRSLIILWSLILLCCIRNRFGVFKLFKLDLSFIFCSIGPILNDSLREKFIARYSLSRACVCVFAGYRAHLLTYEPNLWVKWSMGHKENTHFFVFRNFHFYAFYWHFSIFSLYNTSIFCFQATGHSFSCRNMIFGLREPCTIGNWRLLTFFENAIFYG